MSPESRRPAPRYDDLLRWRARFATRLATPVAILAVVVVACGWLDGHLLALGGFPLMLAALALAYDRRDLRLSHGELAARGGAVVRIANGGSPLARGVAVLLPGDEAIELTGTRSDPFPFVIQLLSIVGGLLATVTLDLHQAAVFLFAALAVSALMLSMASQVTVWLHAGNVRRCQLDRFELRFELRDSPDRSHAVVLFVNGLDARRVERWLQGALGVEFRTGPDSAPAGSGTLREAAQLAEQHDRLRELGDMQAPA